MDELDDLEDELDPDNYKRKVAGAAQTQLHLLIRLKLADAFAALG